jgi:hypothetical protein
MMVGLQAQGNVLLMCEMDGYYKVDFSGDIHKV